jgi:hypothetical protein
MAWIESHQALGHHPKTLRLAAELGCSLPAAVGHLQFLWWFALDYAPDGVLKPGSEKTVARACCWRGRVERFWNALLSAGFLEPQDGGACIHDWREYAGRYVDRRRRDAERKRTSRQVGSEHSGNTSGGQAANVPLEASDRAGHMSGGRPSDVQRTSARTNQPDQPDQPDHEVVRVNDVSGPHARAPDEAEPRRAQPASQECPMCARAFIGSYAEHECAPIQRPPRRLGRILGASTLSQEEIRAAEAELEQKKARAPVDLPPDLLAEDARRRAAERARSIQES